MSRYVAALVYQKRVGSMARKSILAYCAERANDDGTGVWASKVRIAKEVECSKQTVIDTMRAFVSEGLLIECGRRKTSNGYVVDYRVNVAAVKALPDAFEDPFSTDDQSSDLTGPDLDGSNQLTPRGQATGPQEVKPVDPNRPLTVLKPSNKARAESDLFSANEQPESQAERSGTAKKQKEDPIEVVLRSRLSQQAAADFIAHRKALKKPLTARAAELVIAKLEGCADPDAVVNASIMNGWQGVFPERAVPAPTAPPAYKPRERWYEVER